MKIITISGKEVNVLNPTADMISFNDIAHSLSITARYNGHTHEMYTVAQHSVYVSEHVPREYALWGLLHDAAEAYTGDMITPLKRHIPKFKEIENRFTAAIAERFGLDGRETPDQVNLTDKAIYYNEAKALTNHPLSNDMPRLIPGPQIKPWSSPYAKFRFTDRFLHLTASCPEVR